jgi:hypothetical protein
LFLLFTSLFSYANDATGYVRSQCPTTGDSTLRLDRVNGHKLKRELALRIPEQGLWEHLGSDWYDYPGKDCSSDECEPAMHSRVEILQLSYSTFVPFRRRDLKSISGNFVIQLRDGRTITGSFKAKVRSLPRGARCE